MAATRRSQTTSGRKKKPASRKRTPAKKPARTPRLRQELAAQLGGHASDALAIALAVGGLIAALGIFSDLAGPLGDAIDTAASVLFGAGRVFVPIALLFGAAAVVMQRHEEAVGKGWRLG